MLPYNIQYLIVGGGKPFGSFIAAGGWWRVPQMRFVGLWEICLTECGGWMDGGVVPIHYLRAFECLGKMQMQMFFNTIHKFAQRRHPHLL